MPDSKLSEMSFFSYRRCISTIPWKALPLHVQKASEKPDAMVMQERERGKCTIHSSRSKGKFEVSFI